MRLLKCGNTRCAYHNPDGNCISMSIINPETCPEWLDVEQRPSCETCEFYDTTASKNCVNFAVCHNFSQYIRFRPDHPVDPNEKVLKEKAADVMEFVREAWTAGPDTAPKNNIQEGKPRPSLVPMDLLIKYLCPAYEEGLIKYSRESWRKGFQVSIMVDAALRHITEFFWNGHDIDQDCPTGKHHLAGAIFSLLSILHALDTRPELDDRRVKTK